ncbi:RNA polymerase sigma factor SigM [Glycomyces sp. NRRL B-16210]|uniref:RNA polymerase sigma factor SigM n=1 Tax=Glycomyces sp. NRRL B-16210 TaxID=1463821 RepID=UPI00068D1C14|nr:RNA polymerase sigma factor SigM [Glycomyces sp. NRRL B-16210]
MPAPLPPRTGPEPDGAFPGLADAELLRRHVGGDREAFGELFRRHRGRLWAVAVRTLADPEDAAEALQDAMIKAYQAAGSFRGASAVTTWLHRIVVNACLDRIRAAGRRPTVPLPEEDDRLGERDPRPDTPADPQHAALRLSVHQALAELPFDQRAVLVYIDMLGYPVEEVAAILKVRPGTVKSRASRARKRLAPMLAEFGPGEGGPGNPPGQRGVEPGAAHRTATGREEGNR